MTPSITNRSRIGKRERRRLTAVAILSVTAFLNVFYSAQTQQYLGRYLSTNLGGGECEWTAPVPMNAAETNTTTTLLVSYPGSGKRLCWRMLEALTGYEAGDDWDLSLRGPHTPFIKTSYPHPEGVWSWEDSMDQVMIIIRNPRYAIPSYHALRNEIKYSESWADSFSNIDNVYTKHPPVLMWEEWRDLRFETEIDLWCWYIDFWMQDGLRRNDGLNNSFQDPHCITDLQNCRPKAILQFEKIVGSDEAVMIQELDKISTLLDASANMPIIAQEARPCVYKKVLDTKEFYNPRRIGNGPSIEERNFTYQQLNTMKSEISKMKEKYTIDPFQDMPLAQNLVVILDGYIAELSVEYVTAFQNANDVPENAELGGS